MYSEWQPGLTFAKLQADRRLFKAALESETEEDFLRVLRGCGEAEAKYRGHFDSDSILRENTVLMAMAARHDWPEAAAAVINRGCEANATSNPANTALHLAGGYNRRETARVLLEHGADRTAKDWKGNTPADDARSQDHPELALYIDGALARPPRTSTFHPLSARGCHLRRRMGAW